MTYVKYSIADNASGVLNGGISASVDTFALGVGEGASFPASNFVATIVQYNTPGDPTTGVALREKILVGSRSGDTFSSITRGFDGDTGTIFLSADSVFLNVSSIVVEDIQDEVTRLETVKADDSTVIHNTGNEIGISGNKTFTGVITANAFVGNGSSLTAVTFDINGTTADNADLDALDQIVYYDDTAGLNRKRTAKGSESVQGLLKLGTDAEALAGVDDTKAMTPKKSKDLYGQSGIFSGTSATFSDTSVHTGTLTIALGLPNVKTIMFSGYLYLGTYNSPTWSKVVKKFRGYAKLTGASQVDVYLTLNDTNVGSVSNSPAGATSFASSVNIGVGGEKVTSLTTSTLSGSTASIGGIYIDGTDLKFDYSLGAISGPNGQSSGVIIGDVLIIN